MKRCTMEDLANVNRIMKDPDVYPFISDDGSPDRTSFTAEHLLSHPSVYVLQPNEGSIFIFDPFVYRVYWMHTCVLPDFRGGVAYKTGREVCEWMFENANAMKIVGIVEESNMPARVFAIRIGFIREGVFKKSYVKDGRITDLILFGKERKCQQQQ